MSSFSDKIHEKCELVTDAGRFSDEVINQYKLVFETYKLAEGEHFFDLVEKEEDRVYFCAMPQEIKDEIVVEGKTFYRDKVLKFVTPAGVFEVYFYRDWQDE